MRRFLSLSILLLLLWPLISPAFAAISDASLPICCRRDGAHHCMGGMSMPAADTPALWAKPPCCPFCPANISQTQHGPLFAAPAGLRFAGVLSHPSAPAQAETRARVALDRARQKRGPPAALSA